MSMIPAARLYLLVTQLISRQIQLVLQSWGRILERRERLCYAHSLSGYRVPYLVLTDFVAAQLDIGTPLHIHALLQDSRRDRYRNGIRSEVRDEVFVCFCSGVQMMLQTILKVRMPRLVANMMILDLGIPGTFTVQHCCEGPGNESKGSKASVWVAHPSKTHKNCFLPLPSFLPIPMSLSSLQLSSSCNLRLTSSMEITHLSRHLLACLAVQHGSVLHTTQC